MDILLGARDRPRDLRFEKINTRPRRDAYFSFQKKVARGRKTGPRAAEGQFFRRARLSFETKNTCPAGDEVFLFQTGDPGDSLEPREGCPLQVQALQPSLVKSPNLELRIL